MRKIVSFSLFNKIYEGEQKYEDLVLEFPEYNSILSTFLNTATSVLPITKSASREELANLLDDIKSSPLSGIPAALSKFFDACVESTDQELDPEIKSRIEAIHTEMKKLSPIISEIIEQEDDGGGNKEGLVDFIAKWCDQNKEAILKPDAVKESQIILESIKLDPRNMFNVFSSDISGLLTQANAVKTDIDAVYGNPANPKLKRGIDPFKRKIDTVVDELQSGSGSGVNWSTLNRQQAKERIDLLQQEIIGIVNDYTKVIFKETTYGDKLKPLMDKFMVVADKVNILLSDLVKKEKEIEADKLLSTEAKSGDLDWSIKSMGGSLGQRKGKWYQSYTPDGNFVKSSSFIRFGPGELIKGQEKSFKLDGDEWYSSDSDSIDNDSKEWIEIENPDVIKVLNNAYAFKTIKEIEWCVDNNKSLFDKDGSYVPSEDESKRFIPTVEQAKSFDPAAASKLVKDKKGYDDANLSSFTGSDEEGNEESPNSTNSTQKEETVTGENVSKELSGITFKIGDNIFTNENENRKWQKAGKDLTTTWFTPGTFTTPESIKSSGSSLGGYWIRLASGYWELYKGANKPSNDDSKISKIKDLQLKSKENVELFKNIVTSLNSQLEGILKNLKDLSRYWGIGSGKTDIKENAWGGEKDARALVKGGGTKDERIEVEVWPDKLGGSSSSDDIILKVYKNGGLGISDDDYSDSIWGSWKVDDDGKEFIVTWDMYSKGDSSYNSGWKPISQYSKGKIGSVTKFSGPVSGGLKPVLDEAMKRFIQVFY